MKYKPKLWVVYGRRWEPDWLVDDLRANLAWVDGFAEVDDRTRTGPWINEGTYRRLMRRALVQAGVQPWDWVVATSPDERWQTTAEATMRRLIARRTKTIYSFPLREMFTPDAYRVDGIWGRKTRPRLYPFLSGQRFSTRRIQSAPTPVNAGYQHRKVRSVSIYHLKMIEPANRQRRADVFKQLDPAERLVLARPSTRQRLDPEGRWARHGYGYLADTRGMRLKRLTAKDRFEPPYERRYLWEPE